MKRKNEIPELPGQESVRNTLVSFAIAAVYGAVAALGFVSGRELIETVVRRASDGLVVNQNNVVGYSNLGSIAGVAAMALAWLVTLMIVWFKAERAEALPGKLRLGGLWCGGAVAFALVASLATLALGIRPALFGG